MAPAISALDGGLVRRPDGTSPGFVKAVSAATGEEVWRRQSAMPMCASVLATHGDLVFTGEPSGEFDAFDTRTGELLWQFQTGSGHHSSPTAYSVDGRQFIAVPVGWGGWRSCCCAPTPGSDNSPGTAARSWSCPARRRRHRRCPAGRDRNARPRPTVLVLADRAHAVRPADVPAVYLRARPSRS
ncbi:outer membrane protein assembly factor BamB family protein [Streptomyces sp. NPDC001123]